MTISPGSPSDFTVILERCRSGDDAAVGDLFAALYDVLHRIASNQMEEQGPAHTLQPTALIHEAYSRLAGSDPLAWENRAHFLRAAGVAMRSALVDHARAKKRLKRGGENQRLPMESLCLAYESRALDLLQLNEALERLAEQEPRLARLVELRFFAGCSTRDAAKVLGVAERSAQRDWAYARRFLFEALETERE